MSLTWPQFHANDVAVRLRWTAESRDPSKHTGQVEVPHVRMQNKPGLSISYKRKKKTKHPINRPVSTNSLA